MEGHGCGDGAQGSEVPDVYSVFVLLKINGLGNEAQDLDLYLRKNCSELIAEVPPYRPPHFRFLLSALGCVCVAVSCVSVRAILRDDHKGMARSVHSRTLMAYQTHNQARRLRTLT